MKISYFSYLCISTAIIMIFPKQGMADECIKVQVTDVDQRSFVSRNKIDFDNYSIVTFSKEDRYNIIDSSRLNVGRYIALTKDNEVLSRARLLGILSNNAIEFPQNSKLTPDTSVLLNSENISLCAQDY